MRRVLMTKLCSLLPCFCFQMSIIVTCLPACVQKTVWLSLKQFQSIRRRLLQLRNLLLDYHLAAGIPRGESPASSWVESQPTVPLYLHLSLNSSFFFPFFFLSFFFFSNKDPKPISLYHRNLDVQKTPVSSTSPSALF